MILALLFVVAVIFAIAWVAKRFNLAPASSNQIKMVASSSLGGRERIVVIEIQGQQHAIGVTTQSVNHLFQLPEKLESPKTSLADNQLINKINKLFGYTPPQPEQSNISKNNKDSV